MGTWGTKLYDSDTTKDVRGDYIHKLKLKKSSAQTVEELLDAYASLMETDEEPLFWFALADTQWDYGRLLPFVLDKALYFLSDIPALEVTELWREQGRSYEDAWTKTLLKLREKLQTPQPSEKKVLGYRLFRCKWAVGDVFAYRFSSDLSRETGFYGQYVLFQKVGEDTEWPGHIVPSVHVFQWSGNEIPDLYAAVFRGLLVSDDARGHLRAAVPLPRAGVRIAAGISECRNLRLFLAHRLDHGSGRILRLLPPQQQNQRRDHARDGRGGRQGVQRGRHARWQR